MNKTIVSTQSRAAVAGSDPGPVLHEVGTPCSSTLFISLLISPFSARYVASQVRFCALVRARMSCGTPIAARIDKMATTTSISIAVKPPVERGARCVDDLIRRVPPAFLR